MRTLAPATIAALRQVPNAPGLRFRLYLGVWDKLTDPANPQVRLTNFDDYLVQDSLGSIDWTLERSYAQLSPGDIQFQVRDVLDQFEAVVNNDHWGPVEVQIWAAPAWGGAGDWAMLFHGYVEPSGITRAQAEPGDATEPTVPLKDVYAKSYLSARLDAVRAEPLDTWTGVRRLEDVVRQLGDGLISAAGHEPIDYDIQVARIPTKDDRLVLSSWQDFDALGIDGPCWIIAEDDREWSILQWHGSNHACYHYWLDKRTFVIRYDGIVVFNSDHATEGQFLYIDDTYVALAISRRENLASGIIPPDTFLPFVLKEIIVIERSNPRNFRRWRADDHQIDIFGTAGKFLGYLAVTEKDGEKRLAIWANRAEIPYTTIYYALGTVSLDHLRTDQDCEWSGLDTIGEWVCGGAAAWLNGSTWSVSGTIGKLIDNKTYFLLCRGDGESFTLYQDSYHLANLAPGGSNWMVDPQHETGRQAGKWAIYQGTSAALGDANGYDLLSGVFKLALTQGAALYLTGYQHDNNDWPECIALVEHGGPHHHVVHYYTLTRNAIFAEDFYAPGDTLQLANGGGYFTRLNWTPLASRGTTGTTGHFWGWRAWASAPLVLIDARFWPLIDLTVTGAPVTEDETVRDFIGRICEATGHMILFPGRATPQGPIIWRVRPRHTQPPDYCLTARDILADGVDVTGPRKLRLIVTTQGATYAYPDTETLALARMSELSISNNGIPPSVADDFAYWLWLLFETQNRVVKCETDADLRIEIGDSVDVSLGLVDYLQGVVTRQSLDSASGRGRCEMLCAVAVAGINRLTPKIGGAE